MMSKTKDRDRLPNHFEFVLSEPGREMVFKAGGYEVYRIEEEGAIWSYRAMDVRGNNGVIYNGVGLFCDSDSGEHYGTYIMTTEGIFDDKDFGKKVDLYPYQYRPRVPIIGDHHIGEDEWSI